MISSKQTYRLISFDMDDTLLNSEHRISQRTLEAMERAASLGKEVVLATGRCIPELEEYFQQLPFLRYVVCVSGALVYDRKEQKELYKNAIPVETVKKILALGRREDIMIHFLSSRAIVEKDKLTRMADYAMGRHQEMFERVTTPVDNIFDFYEAAPWPVEKINFFITTPKLQAEMLPKLEALGICVTTAEGNSLEMTAPGVSKGTGLTVLCEHLGFTPKEAIAVGDAGNDEEILKIAGLAVAMGNATEEVKRISDVIVADCDHDGCVEAIEKYLLNS